MRNWILLTLFCLNIHLLSAFEEGMPLSSTNGESSSLVDGCVSSITGDYLESEIDLYIPGAEPLYFERTYTSIDSSDIGSMWNGWRHNHHCLIQIQDNNARKERKLEFQAQFIGFTGSTTSYGGKAGGRGYLFKLPLNLEASSKGLTNCSGSIGANTNLKNQTFEFDDINAKARVNKSDGGEIWLSSHFEGVAGALRAVYEKKPNGNYIVYGRSDNGVLASVSATDSKWSILRRNEINPYAKMTFAFDWNVHYMTVTSADGRKVKYDFQEIKARKRDKENGIGHSYYLNKVERPEGPPIQYQYNPKDEARGHQVTKKQLPDNRFLLIEYYSKGHHDVAGRRVSLDKYDWRRNRVKCLKAPVGYDQTPIITRQFIYNEGNTEAFDALNHKTHYHYWADNRLHAIERFTGTDAKTHQVYSRERSYWGLAGTPNFCNLLTKSLEDRSGQSFLVRHYVYDQRGNVLVEKIYGNLSGHNTIPIALDVAGNPINNGCENYSTYYTYTNDSQDNFNLILSERDDFGKEILFEYYPKSNRLKSKFVCENKVIRMRQFFEYDEGAVVIKKIMDDGNCSDSNNLQGVTERHITYITPKKDAPARGLPAQIVEKYLDLASGQEKELSSTEFEYDQNGRLSSKYHFYNGVHAYTLSWAYDDMGRVIRERNAANDTICRKYDIHGNLTEERGPRAGFTKYFTYDYSNRLIRQEEIDSDYDNGSHLCVSHRYNYIGLKTETEDAYGNKTRFEYDDLGRLIRTINPPTLADKGSLVESAVTLTYDIFDQVTSVTDAMGNTTSTSYNIRGQPVDIHYQDGSSEHREYHLNGTLKKTIAKNGLETRFTYDFLSRPTIEDKYSASQQFLCGSSVTYNTFHIISSSDNEGHVSTFTYDDAGRQISVCKGDARKDIAYDSRSRPAKITDWYGNESNEVSVKNIEYDNLDRVIREKVQDALGEVLKCASYRYDADGNRTEITAYMGAGKPNAISTTRYDAYKQPFKLSDALGNSTINTYDYRHKNDLNQDVMQITTTDPLGNRTITTKDALGRVVSIIRKDFGGLVTANKKMYYDANGNRARVEETIITPNAPNRIVNHAFEYDSSNRLVKITEAEGSPKQKITAYTYNIYGQKESIIKPDGIAILHDYDDLGRLKIQSSSDGTLSYDYNYNLNNFLILITDLQTGKTTQRQYDKNDRLVSETLETGVNIGYVYDRKGRPTEVALPDGSGVSYRYDGTYLRQIDRLDANRNVQYSHCYNAYNAMGLLTDVDLIGNTGKAAYKYDQIGRMINADISKNQDKRWTQVIPKSGYDKAGNLKTYNLKDAVSEVTCSFEYDSLYQIIGEKGVAQHSYKCDSLYNRVEKDGCPYEINELNQILQENDRRYSYDDNGNLIERRDGNKVVTYKYDALDRLIEVNDQSKHYQYTYDAFNRRTSKVLIHEGYFTTSRSEIHYVYQGQDEVGAIDLQKPNEIMELRILGIGKGAEIGASIAFELKGRVFAPVHDHNGNLSCLLDSETGNAVETYRYSAFGEEQIFDESGSKIQKSQVDNPWHFSSKRLDPETGFLYFGRRYYDPRIGKWITPDPIGFEGGPNLYAYVMNSPLTHIDLYGLAPALGAQRRICETDSSSFSLKITCKKKFNPLTIPGELAFTIVRNFLPPIPIVRNVLENVCKAFAGELPRLREGWDYTPSRVEVIEGRRVKGFSFMFVNGIMTSFDQAKINAKEFSDAHGGVEVILIYNSSHGFVSDLLETITQKAHINTHPVKLMADQMKQICEANGKDHRIIVGAHSQGGTVVNDTHRFLQPHERKQVHAITFGSASIIEKDRFGSAKNFVSERDAVPFVGDPEGYANAKLGNGRSRSDTVFLKSDGLPLADHIYLDKTYKTQLIAIGKDFQQQELYR